MTKTNDPFLDSLLPYLLQRASFVVTQQFHNHLKLNGVSVSRWRLLAWLSDHDNASINELRDQLMLKQPTVTRLVDKAIRDELVIKESDKEDARRVQVKLTKTGRKLIQQLKSAALEAENQIANKYDPAAVSHLKQDLLEIIEQFDDTKLIY